jgi:hypothetical protein
VCHDVVAKVHDGTICTEKPNEFWGTDGTLGQPMEEGAVWILAAVEHWSSECVGTHAMKESNRLRGHGAREVGAPQALQPRGWPCVGAMAASTSPTTSRRN